MENANAEHQLRITKIVWVVFLVSQVSFLAALFLAKPEFFKINSNDSFLTETPIIPIIFALFALFDLALSFFLKSLAIKKAAEEQNLKLVQSAVILALAFCEAISISGLVLAFAFNYKYFFVWFALGIFGIILHYPRRADMLAADYKKL